MTLTHSRKAFLEEQGWFTFKGFLRILKIEVAVYIWLCSQVGFVLKKSLNSSIFSVNNIMQRDPEL